MKRQPPTRVGAPNRSGTKPSTGASGSRAEPNGVWWRVGVIVAACAATYWNSLEGPFISDDLVSIVMSHQLREWWSVTSMLFPLEDTSFAGRPVAHFSFAINYALGGLDVRGYHIGNVLVHTGCALLVFAVVARTLRLPSVNARIGEAATHLGFATALVWAVHPLNSDAVNYLSQRTESLMAFFYLLTVYASIRALDSPRKGRWGVAAVLSCALGMACKESMVTAPAMVVLYDRMYVFESLTQAARSRWRLYTGLAVTWFVLGALLMTGGRGGTSGFSGAVTPWTYLLNQAVIITQYLRLAVWPRSLVVDYGWVLPLTLGDVWPHALVVVALLWGTVVALSRKPHLGFLGAWFFTTLSPTSSVVPIANEVGRECRMYLPMVAFVTLAIVGIAALWRTGIRAWPWVPSIILTRQALAGGILLLALSTSLAAATVSRNRDYQSPLTLYRGMVERWPTPRAHHIYASELIRIGRREEAIPHLRAAADAVPWAHYDLGLELLTDGKLDEAVEHLEKFVEIWASPPADHPHWQRPLRVQAAGARAAIGKALARQQRWPDAIEQYRLALAIEPAYADALAALADALLTQGTYGEAIARYREYPDAPSGRRDWDRQFGSGPRRRWPN